jgi:acetoin utilization deacetylase AcuC-like enzyme/L-amino acid N-acyltransferase YncA
MVISDGHDRHRVEEEEYIETPERIDSIRDALAAAQLVDIVPMRAFHDRHLRAVHDPNLIQYLRDASAKAGGEEYIYPYIFPLRNRTRPPRERHALPGYFCMDTFTPIHRQAYPAARRAVDGALTAAALLRKDRRWSYALVRPPGHHSERGVFGGFCYFNNTAAATHYLSRWGKVAVLDVDFHHGNGQQEIFYRRSDILTISLHGHPQYAFPYFTGFADERGEGPGRGYNLNLPLPKKTDGKAYRQALDRALRRIRAFAPSFLVVALGFDTAAGDPTGEFRLEAEDFEANGRLIGTLGLPTMVVQEGGYRIKELGRYAHHFFRGLISNDTDVKDILRRLKKARSTDKEPRWRYEVQPEDPRRIGRLVAATGFFKPGEVRVAVELVEERLAKGTASGYYFIVIEEAGRIIGYTCYGPTPCTESSFDLYWIAVQPDVQRRGIGRQLMAESERRIAAAGGKRVYVETSQRPDYAATRAFYERCDYRVEAILTDFYAPGDGKVVYCKLLG